MEGFLPLLVIAVIGFFVYLFFFRNKGPAKQQKKRAKTPATPKTTKNSVNLRNIFFNVSVKRIDKRIGERLNKFDSVWLRQEGARSEYPSAISVFTAKNKWLGYIEKDVAHDIRESSLLDELHCHVHEVWEGNRGGFGVYLNLRGTQSTYEKWLEYQVSCRKPKESSKPYHVDGYSAVDYGPDLALYKSRKQWDELEALLIKLSDAERIQHKPEQQTSHYIGELGKLYFKQKRYSDAIPCFEEVVLIHGAHNKPAPKPVLNQLAKSKEKTNSEK